MGNYALFISKAPAILAQLRQDFSLSVEQAAGIVGNLGHECAGFRLMQEQTPIHGGRGGYGWAQWTGKRRDQFEAWAQENGLAVDSDDANYGFLRHELQGSEAASIAALKNCTSLEEAVRVFEQHFERADTHHKGYASRDEYARIARDAYLRGRAPAVAPVQESWGLAPSPPAIPALAVGAHGPQVLALQEALSSLGYPLGKKDGIFGKLTRQALLAFQAENRIPTSGVADAATWKAFNTASPRSLSRERMSATPRDVLALGSETILDAFRTRNLGWLAGILGVLGLTNSAAMKLAEGPIAAVDATAVQQALGRLQTLIPALKQAAPAQMDQIRAMLQSLRGDAAQAGAGAKSIVDGLIPGDGSLNALSSVVASFLPGFGGSLLTLGIGIAAHVFARNIAAARTADYQDGSNIGR